MIWVRKNWPERTRNAPTSTHRAISARSRTRYESKPFISRIQTDREPLPEQQQHQQREEGGSQRLEGAVERELGQERAVAAAAGGQNQQVAHPESDRHEPGVDQGVVCEEYCPRPRRQVADDGVSQRPGAELGGGEGVRGEPDEKAGHRGGARTI